MEISVTYRHVQPNGTLKEYVEEKVFRIKKYFDRPVKADVILSLEKKRYIAEVNITGDRIALNSKEISIENFFEAIALVMDKLISQASRYKTKRKKRTGDPELTIRHNIISPESGNESEEPKVIHTENFFVKPMNVEEAIMQMKLVKKDFLVFTDAQSNQVSVLYQRRDGNYGLIETKKSNE